MTLKTYLLPLGTACALLLSVIVAHSQTNPLPPGLTRGPSTASTAKTMPSRTSPLTPAKTLPATSTEATESSLVGASSEATSVATGGSTTKTNSTRLNFNGADSLILLMAYAEATGRTLIPAPDVPKATITLKSQPEVELTKEEYLEAIEKTLAINSIVLVPDGKKFLKVFAKGKVRTEGINTIMDEPEGLHPEMGRTISQMITFKFLAVSEGQKALEGFKKPDGLFQVFERTNTILVTDTQENINRMLEIVKFIDKPIEITDEVQVRTIKYAKADDIKKRIEELVAESQKQQQAKEEIKSNTSGGPGTTRSTVSPTTSSLLGRTLPPGLIRPTAPTTTPTPVVNNETLSAMVNDADRGMIRGKVQVIADERSNKLIVVTRPENMLFFDKIIEVLDIPTAPDIQVKIIRLQHATADGSSSKDGSEKGIADVLNELIGNASASKSTTGAKSSSSTSNKRSSPYPTPNANQNLTSATPVPAPAPAVTRTTPADREGTGKVGELSKENITILSDKRINGLIVMASPTDMAIIEAIIKELDVELEQVIIETVLLQVKLNDTIRTGIDWVHSKVQHKGDITTKGGGGAGNYDLDALMSGVGTLGKVAGAKYYFLFDKLDLNMVVQAAKEDTRTKVLQSPVLMTVNNKEAILESTDMAYLYKGLRASGSSMYGGYNEVPDYEQRDFGVIIKITPRISPNGNVTMTVDQKFETRGADQAVGGGSSSTNDSTAVAKYPTISTTKLQADVSVKSGQTIMLGGLIKTLTVVNDSGIPVLKDIPLIGRYLFGSTENTEESSELMVFLTPHVVKGSLEAQNDAGRRLENTNMDGVWSKGWSNSELAEAPKFGDMLDKEYRKLEQLKREHEAEVRLKEFEQRHKDNKVHTNLLYNKRYTLPVPSQPEEKGVTPAEPQPPSVQKTPTILSGGPMRVLEEKTEPLLTDPVPEKAPAAE